MKKKSKNSIPIDLIARKLSGEADQQEISSLLSWLEESGENREIFSSYEKLWERSGSLLPMDFDIESEWEYFKSLRSGNVRVEKRHRILSNFSRIAAAATVAIIIGIGSLVIYNTMRFEKISAGSRVADITLPDGSRTYLYPGSEIKYPRKFDAEKRDVELEGEAFFDVVRDTLRAFSVSSGDMIVKVLGTSFNIEALSTSSQFNVVVETGKVLVSNSANPDNSEYLMAGDRAKFNKSSGLIEKDINDDVNYNAWQTNRIIFENSGLEEIASTLSKIFVRNIFSENLSEDQSITVTFENRSLDYILETIEATLDIEVVVTEKEIILR